MSEQNNPFSVLTAAGLNRVAVFDFAGLPDTMRTGLLPVAGPPWRQLILIGHAGRRLWSAVQEAIAAGEVEGAHPIDSFTVCRVRCWLDTVQPGCRHEIVYPGPRAVGLQALGRLAGWHHASPFRVGIDAHWGSWFAYRAVLLADTRFTPSVPETGPHPCTPCVVRPCVAACPAGALTGDEFDLTRCLNYRRQPASACAATCLARLACPVGSEHRYDAAQLAHSYGRSLADLARYLP